jgi:hypothetical protein
MKSPERKWLDNPETSSTKIRHVTNHSMGKPYDLDNLASSAESSLRVQLMVQYKKHPLL